MEELCSRLDGRIFFGSYVNVDGSNPKGEQRLNQVNPDGTGLEHFPHPVAVSGSHFDPTFVITGRRLVAWALDFFGLVKEAPDFVEIYAFDARWNGLQLTNFHRKDTGSGDGVRADVDGPRVLFTASVDPFGTNPSESCQIFSIDRLGTALRQITTFNQGAGHSATGCGGGGLSGQSPPECTVGDLRQDEVTRAVLFRSTCDVFGDNPYGEQLFAMNPDGTALRWLTHTPRLHGDRRHGGRRAARPVRVAQRSHGRGGFETRPDQLPSITVGVPGGEPGGGSRPWSNPHHRSGRTCHAAPLSRFASSMVRIRVTPR